MQFAGVSPEWHRAERKCGDWIWEQTGKWLTFQVSWNMHLFLSLVSGVWTRWTLWFHLPLQKLETLKRESILLGCNQNSRRRRKPPFRRAPCTRISLHGQGPVPFGWMLLAEGHQGPAYLEAEAMGLTLLKGAWLSLHHLHHSVTWWLKFQNGWKIPWG